MARTEVGDLFIKTPLIRSDKLSSKLGASVWLKLENLQNTFSFKVRGIGNLCKHWKKDAPNSSVLQLQFPDTDGITDDTLAGGNAGLAATYCAQHLKKPIQVIVPESTPASVVEKLKKIGADVLIFGKDEHDGTEEVSFLCDTISKVWDDANKKALEIASSTPGAQYISPFDNPLIWSGHSSMIDEIKEQLHGNIADVIVVAVGGGGLLCGMCQGLHQVGWGHVPVVAMETAGCDSLNRCVREKQWTELPDITSAAKCLGARRVCQQAYQWLSDHKILSCVIEDKQAASACLQFADDHHMLVELACGAALAAGYGDSLQQLVDNGKLSLHYGNVVLVVCGGSAVSVDTLIQWKNTFSL